MSPLKSFLLKRLLVGGLKKRASFNVSPVALAAERRLILLRSQSGIPSINLTQNGSKYCQPITKSSALGIAVLLWRVGNSPMSPIIAPFMKIGLKPAGILRLEASTALRLGGGSDCHSRKKIPLIPHRLWGVFGAASGCRWGLPSRLSFSLLLRRRSSATH